MKTYEVRYSRNGQSHNSIEVAGSKQEIVDRFNLTSEECVGLSISTIEPDNGNRSGTGHGDNSLSDADEGL